MAREMKIGDSAASAVGNSGTTVGRSDSALMKTVKNVILAGVMLTAAQEMVGSRMKIGDSMQNTLGSSGEAYASQSGGMLGKMLMAGLLVEGAFKLVEAMASPAAKQDGPAVSKPKSNFGGLKGPG